LGTTTGLGGGGFGLGGGAIMRTAITLGGLVGGSGRLDQ
jgi:hypothetical protein